MASASINIGARWPAVRVLLAFLPGILVQWYLQPPVAIILTVLCCSLALSLLFFCLPLHFRFRFSLAAGICMVFFIGSTAALLTWMVDVRHDSAWPGDSLSGNKVIIASLLEQPTEKANSFKAVAQLCYTVDNNAPSLVHGRVLIYFAKTAGIASLQPNSLIAFNGSVERVKSMGNPGGFDFAGYCLLNGVTHQAYVPANAVATLSKPAPLSPGRLIFRLQQWTNSILKKFIPGKKEQGLAEALLIGYKNDLDPDLVRTYASTGVVHVIAISGLHLGIIYWLLLSITKPLANGRWRSWIRLLLILASLWLFSVLAGAQPSVLRSAVMFTVLASANVLRRRTSGYNSLALSAFVLLCYNPLWLWDAGFQLSYAAVLSIMAFYRPISAWLIFRNPAIDAIWKMVAVTIAAQLLTLPLGLYLFHQFPILFLLTNIVAIPLSSIILLIEIAICIFSFVPALAQLGGNGAYWLIRAMNGYIELIDQVPFAVWKNIAFGASEAWMLALLIVLAGFWLSNRSALGLRLFLGSGLCFLALRTYLAFKANAQKRIVVYATSKPGVVEFISGRRTSIMISTSPQMLPILQQRILQPAHLFYRTTQTGYVRQGLFSFDGHLVLFAGPASVPKQVPERNTLDYLILGDLNVRDSILLGALKSNGILIFTPVLKQGVKKAWQLAATRLGTKIHDVSSDGAFVADLKSPSP